MKKSLEIVLKVTERCNIDCTYCYVFNKGDTSYKKHPPVIRKDTIEALIRFIESGIQNEGIEQVFIDFHGGEPLLMKKSDFVDICEHFTTKLSSKCTLSFALQTNAILIDDEWIDIFIDYEISVGVSLDGDEASNDEYRIYSSGKGSHIEVLAGLKKLLAARDEGLLLGVGILCVPTGNMSGEDSFKYFSDELNIGGLNYLLPIDSHESKQQIDFEFLSTFLCSAFDEWIKNSKVVDIRMFKETINSLINTKESIDKMLQQRRGQHTVMTVASDGSIEQDDTLRPIKLKKSTKQSVFDLTFSDYMKLPLTQNLMNIENKIPSDCEGCCWKNICRGGAAFGRVINRYSHSKGFNNASIICDTLKNFYSHVASYLLNGSISYEKLCEGLVSEYCDFTEYDEPCDFSIKRDIDVKTVYELTLEEETSVS